MTAPYSPEVRKRLEALAARCEQIAADHASPFKDGRVFDGETLAAIQWYKQEAADLSAALAHIERLEGALRDIRGNYATVQSLSEARNIAARALNGASHDQG